MPLPILTSPPTADLLRLFHRAELHFAQQLGDSTPLDVGTAIIGTQAPTAANRAIFEAALPAGLTAAAAIDQVNAAFAATGSACRTWVMNPAAPPSAKQSLIDALLARQATAVARDVLYLKSPVGRPAQADGVTVIPARASFRHAEQLAAAREGGADSDATADHLARLDDPRWDALLALVDTQAAGTIGVLSVGDIGLIAEWFVAPNFRRRGVGRLLLDRAIEIAERSVFKHVFVGAVAGSIAHRLLTDRGFVVIGLETRYVLPG